MRALRQHLHALALAGLLGLGSACATGPAVPMGPAAAAPQAAALAAGVAVVKSLGRRQCEGGGTTTAALAQALQGAGVQVRAQACAHDGRMRAAVCGAADGTMAWFEVPGDQLAQAQALGFVEVNRLPGAQRQDCR